MPRRVLPSGHGDVRQNVEVGLIGDDRLAGSWVVANRDMNRARGLSGRDGYARVLGVDLHAHLTRAVRWLDLCCGQGKALLEAAVSLPEVRITGVDLVGDFAGEPPARVRFLPASVAEWVPEDRFDLITCVHGLHYVGDKLGLLARIASWLTDGGFFVANIDVDAIRLPSGEPAGRRVRAALRAAGFAYDGRAPDQPSRARLRRLRLPVPRRRRPRRPQLHRPAGRPLVLRAVNLTPLATTRPPQPGGPLHEASAFVAHGAFPRGSSHSVEACPRDGGGVLGR